MTHGTKKKHAVSWQYSSISGHLLVDIQGFLFTLSIHAHYEVKFSTNPYPLILTHSEHSKIKGTVRIYSSWHYKSITHSAMASTE